MKLIAQSKKIMKNHIKVNRITYFSMIIKGDKIKGE